MGLTVVGLAGSTCTGRVLATLFEKNVEDFEVKPVDFASGEHKKPQHLKLQVSNGLKMHFCLQGSSISWAVVVLLHLLVYYACRSNVADFCMPCEQ